MTRTITRSLGLLALLLSVGCTPLMDAFSGEDGIRPDPADRTMGTVIDDEMIESMAAVNIRRADPALGEAHVSVTSYNGIVLLAGQVPSEPLSRKAEETVLELRRVRHVHNELEVAGPTSLLTRSGDGWVTGKVKTRLIADKDVPGREIKVVTENGVVYLMGLAQRADADRAAEIARNTGGVRRVVKMFEYLD